MNKIKVKDWPKCPLNIKGFRVVTICNYSLDFCPDKKTGERPTNCPLPVTIEFEKGPVAYDEKEHGTLPIL